MCRHPKGCRRIMTQAVRGDNRLRFRDLNDDRRSAHNLSVRGNLQQPRGVNRATRDGLLHEYPFDQAGSMNSRSSSSLTT